MKLQHQRHLRPFRTFGPEPDAQTGSAESQKSIVLIVRGEARAADVPPCTCPGAAQAAAGLPRGAEAEMCRAMPCRAGAASVPSGGCLAAPCHCCRSSAPRWSRTGSFSAPFPPPAFESPPKLSAFFFVIPARIKYDCSREAPRSQLPSGTVCPHHLSDREPACPWKNMYFRPPGC